MRLSNLEEGSYNNAPEPKKMQVTVADKKANTEAWKRYQAGDSRYEFKNPTTEAEQDGEAIPETSTISTRQNFNTSDKGGVQTSNYTSHTRDFDSKKGLSTLTTAQQQDGSTSSRFVMPGGSGVATKNGVERNIQMKGPQSWAYDKPKLNASKEPKVREAGSPWTTTGKHPEKMTVDELWGEIAVFDHIQDRGERLTPKDMMRLDSLFSYMDTAEMNEAIKRKADSMMESAKFKKNKNK
jgi:hypothetical protein